MTEPLRLGVIGANSFVARKAIYPAVESTPAVEIAAAASHSGVPDEIAATAVKSYEAVVEHPAVEAIYIPLPNTLHREWTERAAAAGKHVLCEKPLATDPADAAAMYAACAGAGVVLAEAYMTAFHPRSLRLLAEVTGGALGAIRSVTSEFTFTIGPEHSDNYRWRPEMGGGAVWDVGIYTLSPIFAMLPQARLRSVVATRAPTGVDATTVVTLESTDAVAQAICSFELAERQSLVVRGTEATLFAERPFTPSTGDTLLRIHGRNGSVAELHAEGADPYRLMLEAFAGAVRGVSPWPRTEQETLGLIARIAEISALAGQPDSPDQAAP